MRLREYDMAAGEFPYGERIALAGIFARTDLSDYGKMKAAWRELYGWNARLMPPLVRARAFTRLVEGLNGWVQREQEMLAYTPTPDEAAAGYEAYCKRIGPTGTIYALAKDYGCDPDTILRWPYAKVFGILYHDLEQLKFGRAYDKVLSNKAKRYGNGTH